DLRKANLRNTSLRGAFISGSMPVYTRASRAAQIPTRTRLTNLWGADLSGADLTEANLEDAIGINNEELEKQVKSLHDAITPDKPARKPQTIPESAVPKQEQLANLPKERPNPAATRR